MRSRKVRYGEQKLLELIDEEMEKVSNLDYSQIKEKIKIEEKGNEKVESTTNYFLLHIKYALSIIIVIISIITYFASPFTLAFGLWFYRLKVFIIS